MSIKAQLLFIVFAALLITCRAEEEILSEEGVLVLTDKNFDAAVNKYEFLLVEFYAPWCGHCKELLPEYQRAAKVLIEGETPVVLAKIDATVEKNLAERFEVEGFPSLKFFAQQNPMEYTGGRTEAEIISWCQKKTGPATEEIKDQAQLDQLQLKNTAVFVLFQKTASKDELEAFNKVSRTFEEASFAYTSAEALVSKYSSTMDQKIMAFRTFDEKEVTMDKEINEINLTEFIGKYELPSVMEFNQRSAEKIFGENSPALILLYAKGCPISQKARDILLEIAPTVKQSLLISESVINEGLGERLAEYIGISESDLPAFRIVAPKEDDVQKYYFTEEVNAANLLSFVEGFKAGTLKATFKSEEIPDKNDEPVKVIVGKTWDSIVKDNTKDVLVEFYAPWCGHCKTLAPIYDKMAAGLAGNANIVIAKLDATANEIQEVPIQGFPTIKFYPANNKEGIEYDGDRTEKGILEFLEKNTTFDWVVAEQKSDL